MDEPTANASRSVLAFEELPSITVRLARVTRADAALLLTTEKLGSE